MSHFTSHPRHIALFCAAALAVGIAHTAEAAPTYTTDFSTFTLGDVQGQQGWAYPGNSPTVGSIVNTTTTPNAPANIGPKALQLTETSNSALFGVANGVNAPRVTPIGEPGTSTAGGTAATGGNVFVASFYYRTPDRFNPSDSGVVIAFNPASSSSSTVATRYGFFGLETNSGSGYMFAIEPNFDLPTITVLDNVKPGTWYQVSEQLTFVPGLNIDGSPNDVFNATVTEAGTATTGSGTGVDWEDGYRSDPSFGTLRPLAVDTLDFLNRGGPVSANEGQIANLSFGAPAATAVPEPASMLVLGAGLAGLVARRRRA